jgi:hypothetical protein
MPAPFTTEQLGEVQGELMRIAAAEPRPDADELAAVLKRIAELDPEGTYIAVGLALGFGLTICTLSGLSADLAPDEGWGFEVVDDATGEPVNPDAIVNGPEARGLLAATRVVMACANGAHDTASDHVLAAVKAGDMAYVLLALMRFYRGARHHGTALWE